MSHPSKIVTGPVHLAKHQDYRSTLSSPHAAISSTIINLAKAVIGAGILTYPQTFMWNGLIFNFFLIGLCALTIVTTAKMILKAADWVGALSYEDLVQHTFGKTGSFLLTLLITIRSFGTLTAYMIILRDSCITILDSWGVSGWDNRPVLTVFAVCVTLPLSLMKNLNSLRYTSFLALALMASFQIGMMVRLGSISNEDTWHASDLTLGRLSVDLLRSLPVIAFGMTIHLAMFPIRIEMKDPSYPVIKSALHKAFCIDLVLYYGMGVIGFVSFMSNTKSNIANNYNDGSRFSAFMNLCVLLNIAFIYPLICRPVVIACDYLLFHHNLGPAIVNFFYDLVHCRLSRCETLGEYKTRASHHHHDQLKQQNTAALPSFDASFMKPFPSEAWSVDGPDAVIRHRFETLFFFTSSLLVAIFVKDLGVVVGITGALGNTTISILVPPLIYLFVDRSGQNRMKHSAAHDAHHAHYDNPRAPNSDSGAQVQIQVTSAQSKPSTGSDTAAQPPVQPQSLSVVPSRPNVDGILLSMLHTSDPSHGPGLSPAPGPASSGEAPVTSQRVVTLDLVDSPMVVRDVPSPASRGVDHGKSANESVHHQKSHSNPIAGPTANKEALSGPQGLSVDIELANLPPANATEQPRPQMSVRSLSSMSTGSVMSNIPPLSLFDKILCTIIILYGTLTMVAGLITTLIKV